MRPPAQYNPAWPRCGFCGTRHPADNPHLPDGEYELWDGEKAIFIGFKEQCGDRARIVPLQTTVRRRHICVACHQPTKRIPLNLPVPQHIPLALAVVHTCANKRCQHSRTTHRTAFTT